MSPLCTRYCTVHTRLAVTIPNSLCRLSSDLMDVTTLYQVLYCTYTSCCDHSPQSVQAGQRPPGCHHSVPGTVLYISSCDRSQQSAHCTSWAATHWMLLLSTRYDYTRFSVNFSWKMIWKWSGSYSGCHIRGSAGSNQFQLILFGRSHNFCIYVTNWFLSGD